MPTHASWSIRGSDDQPILGDTHTPDGDAAGVILLAHGFKGYKDYGFFPHLAEAAARHGLIAHRFNFSHSGMTNNIETFERPDLFEADTWGKQVYDLQRVASAVRIGELTGGDLPQTWFGHSRGGVTTLLTAGRAFADDGAVRPSRVVSAAAPHYTVNMDDATRQLMREQGHLESPSGRTGQALRVGRAWLEEVEADPDAFDPMRAVSSIACPILIVHGTADATVPVESAHTLAAATERGPGQVTKVVMSEVNHVFNGRNPLPLDEEPATLTQQFIETVCEFVVSN